MSCLSYNSEGTNRPQPNYEAESLRLEAVTVCVGFDDILDVTLPLNHPHLDHLIVVTAHKDKATKSVCRKHGVTCVETDLFSKNGRNFNKGAAINAGFNYFQYHGWRLHIDSDVILPDNFRRLIFNHTHLNKDCIYGADRIDVFGKLGVSDNRARPQHVHGMLVDAGTERGIGSRYVDAIEGYVPIGFFQMWHASCQRKYPFSVGTAAHDDVMFGSLWPRSQRILLPSVICHHLVTKEPRMGENWDGNRKQPRLQ